jgi:hypothetical protein
MTNFFELERGSLQTEEKNQWGFLLKLTKPFETPKTKESTEKQYIRNEEIITIQESAQY